MFLQQSRDAGRAALSLMDRLDHYFAGQLLEAQYLLRLGRLRESYLLANSMRQLGYLVNRCSQLTSTALLRFAMACDLHRISDPRQHMSSYSGLLGQPADIYAVAERINLWWSCYILAHQLSTLIGLPNDLPAGSAVVRPSRTILRVSNLSGIICRLQPSFRFHFCRWRRCGIIRCLHKNYADHTQQKGFDAWSPGSARELLQPASPLSSVEADSVLSASAKSAILMTNALAYLESPAGQCRVSSFELRIMIPLLQDSTQARRRNYIC
jgi:hypothetical protein